MLINQFGSERRMCLALDTESLDALGERIESLMDLQPPQGVVAKVKALGRLRELASFSAKTVRDGPCQEIWLDEPDLDRLPILTCWPDDGGPFVTLPLVFSRDPRTGARNCGMYRIQKLDRRTAMMHWQIHKDGAAHLRDSQGRVPVAVAIGSHPATTYSATAPLPPGIDEMIFAGFLRGRSVEMVRCRTVDLEVPAESEVVLEGYVDATDLRPEGPFGDHTGFYTPVDDYPTFHLTGMSMRSDAVYATTIVGPPPMEDFYLGKATERLFLPIIRMTLPDLVDMNLPLEGVFHNCAIVSVNKRYPGHAKKLMSAIWGLGLLSLSRCVVVVDHDVDVQDVSAVAFQAFSNVDAGPRHAGRGGPGGRARPRRALLRLRLEGGLRRHPQVARRGDRAALAGPDHDERRRAGAGRPALGRVRHPDGFAKRDVRPIPASLNLPSPSD